MDSCIRVMDNGRESINRKVYAYYLKFVNEFWFLCSNCVAAGCMLSVCSLDEL